MEISSLSARLRAIRELQVCRDKYPHGSKRFDELDHAIDLALNPRRRVDQFLFRNALRDAERILRRRRRRARIILEADLLPGPEGTPRFVLEDAVPDVASPEADLCAEHTLLLAAKSRGANDRSHAVLTSLIQGDTTREMATALKISPAHAFTLMNRARSTLHGLTGA